MAYDPLHPYGKDRRFDRRAYHWESRKAGSNLKYRLEGTPGQQLEEVSAQWAEYVASRLAARSNREKLRVAARASRRAAREARDARARKQRALLRREAREERDARNRTIREAKRLAASRARKAAKAQKALKAAKAR